MDYIVSGKTPDVAQAVVPHAQNADGTVSPIGASNPQPVAPPAVPSAAVTKVNSSASNGTLLAANSSRQGAKVVNTDANALLLKYGATASSTSFTVRIAGGAYWEMPDRYTGQIDGMWEAAGSGAAMITET
jgi:hypothetical protein